MADPSHFWIGLCLVGDKATVTSSIDFHCGVSREDCEPNLHFSQSTNVRLGHKQTFRCVRGMSALSLKVDINPTYASLASGQGMRSV